MNVIHPIGGTIVRTTLLRTACLLAVALLLVACTRDRPEAEPAATTAAEVTPVAVTGTPTAAEAATEETTEEATEEVTPTPEEEAAGETFDYTVRAGDTLAAIAGRFDTTVQTLRELNFLLDDNIFGGQVLAVPYIEGMTAEGAPTPTPAPFAYVVESGDTLNSIAIQFGVDPITLVEVNSIIDPNNLSVGTELLIPGYTAPASSSPSGTGAGDGTSSTAAPATGEGGAGGDALVVHVVQPGETLNQIAIEYGVDVAVLSQANRIANGNLIRVGQRLVIPGLTERQALEARGTRHVVLSGESLTGIALRYGVSTEVIMALNSLDDPNTIVVGQELLIPPAE
jgi:LysM repeat protein